MKNKIWLYAVLAPFDVIGTLFFNLFVNWWAALFADDDGWLPNWLKWAQTFDASLDTGWKDKWPKSNSLWWDRTKWLYRNSAYGWSYYILGCRWCAYHWLVVTNRADLVYMKSVEGYFYYYRDFGVIQIKLGWKASNMYSGERERFEGKWGPEYRIPIVVSVNIPAIKYFFNKQP